LNADPADENRRTPRARSSSRPRRPAVAVAAAAIASLLLGLAAADYLGWHFYYRYKAERASARSIQSGFERMEKSLRRGLRFSANPLLLKERTRLELEMAMAENEFGTPAARDARLDLALAAAHEWVRRNPADAWAYYEMGKIYLLYNFPLLTYADRGRACLRQALELKPADEFLNLNILYIFMTQWDFLEAAEREFVAAQWGRLTKNSPDFREKMRRRWKEYYGEEAGLDRILEQITPARDSGG